MFETSILNGISKELVSLHSLSFIYFCQWGAHGTEVDGRDLAIELLLQKLRLSLDGNVSKQKLLIPHSV